MIHVPLYLCAICIDFHVKLSGPTYSSARSDFHCHNQDQMIQNGGVVRKAKFVNSQIDYFSFKSEICNDAQILCLKQICLVR